MVEERFLDVDHPSRTRLEVAVIKAGDRKQYISAAAGAIEAFTQQQQRLTDLALKGGRRARAIVSDASAEIDGIHRSLSEAVSVGLGLRGAR